MKLIIFLIFTLLMQEGWVDSLTGFAVRWNLNTNIEEAIGTFHKLFNQNFINVLKSKRNFLFRRL